MAARGAKFTYKVGSSNYTDQTNSSTYDLVQEAKNIGFPDVQSYNVEVPGRNGLLNLTQALTGSTVYNNREIKLTYFCAYPEGDTHRTSLLTMLNRMHGQIVNYYDLDVSTTKYYTGECSISWDEVNAYYCRFTVTIDAEPNQH